MNLVFEKYTETKSQIWEGINLSAQNSTFLSSISWIDFKKLLGQETDQFLIYSNNLLVGNLYIEIYRRKFVRFAYSPYGPVVDTTKLTGQNLEAFFAEAATFMKRYISEKGLTLFRVDPLLGRTIVKDLEKLGFETSLAPAQAKDTWMIDLSRTEEELRSGMSDSTRHNVNKASKSAIEIVKASSEEEIKAFADLMQETTQRKGFGNYNFDYFKRQWEFLNPKGMTEIFLAKYTNPENNQEKKFIAGALVNYYKDTAYYTHGASTSDKTLSKLRSPYFLQWSIMKEAKDKGLKKYNMWGCLPEEKLSLEDFKHPLKGVSEFKRSFGGYEVNYLGPVEVYSNPLKYAVHRLADWWAYRSDRY